MYLSLLTFFRLQSADLHALFVPFPCDSPNATRDPRLTDCPAIRLGTKGGGAGASADVAVIAFPRSPAVFSVPLVPALLHTGQLVFLLTVAGHLSFRFFWNGIEFFFFPFVKEGGDYFCLCKGFCVCPSCTKGKPSCLPRISPCFHSRTIYLK